MAGRRVLARAVGGAVAIALAATSAVASPAAGAPRIRLVGHDDDGRPAWNSDHPAVSRTGRVSFSSQHALVPSDTSPFADVYVEHVAGGPAVLVSVGFDGSPTDGASYMSAISGDGRYVAFASTASNLVPGDTPSTSDVFLRDVVAGTTTLVSATTAGLPAGEESAWPSISDDGRLVAFHSRSDDLVPQDGNGDMDVFVRDVVAGTTTRISAPVDGAPDGGGGRVPDIGADGTAVAFHSGAGDLVAGDTDDGLADVFVWHRGVVVKASIGHDGQPANEGGGAPSISGNGRYVAYATFSTNMVPGPQNAYDDVFVTDVVTGTTRLVSVGVGGVPSNNESGDPSISADGRLVAFTSYATNLVPGPGAHGSRSDIFVRDVVAGTTTMVNTDLAGRYANGYSNLPDIAADGRAVVFTTEATDLVAEANRGGIMVALLSRYP